MRPVSSIIDRSSFGATSPTPETPMKNLDMYRSKRKGRKGRK
jgi:hypothetical protein